MPRTTKTNAAAAVMRDGFSYSTLESYLGEVRVLLSSRLDAEWTEELIEGDAVYLKSAYERQDHPAAAALDIFVTREESERVPAPFDTSLRVEASEQARRHLAQLVGLGLWGATPEAVAQSLLHQAIAAKLESGILRASGPK